MTNLILRRRHTQKVVRAFKALLDDHLGKGDCIEKVSAQAGLNRNALQKAFKKQFGITIRDYKMKIRMDRSCEMLKAGKDIKEISIDLHYTTTRAFSHAFKKYFGVTPSEYVATLPPR